MELVLPSIFLLLLASLFAYLVVPRFGPMTLAIVSLLALVAAIVDHAYRFSNEYRMSTWQTALRSYSSWIVLGFALIIAIVFLMQMVAFAKGGAVATAIAATGAAAANTAKAAVANVAKNETILEKVTNSVQNSIAALPTVAEAAKNTTNPIVATVNKGLNAMGINTTAAPTKVNEAKKPNAVLPFSPSSI